MDYKCTCYTPYFGKYCENEITVSKSNGIQVMNT